MISVAILFAALIIGPFFMLGCGMIALVLQRIAENQERK